MRASAALILLFSGLMFGNEAAVCTNSAKNLGRMDRPSYDVGDVISIEDQLFPIPVCFGDYPEDIFYLVDNSGKLTAAYTRSRSCACMHPGDGYDLRQS